MIRCRGNQIQSRATSVHSILWIGTQGGGSILPQELTPDLGASLTPASLPCVPSLVLIRTHFGSTSSPENSLGLTEVDTGELEIFLDIDLTMVGNHGRSPQRRISEGPNVSQHVPYSKYPLRAIP